MKSRKVLLITIGLVAAILIAGYTMKQFSHDSKKESKQLSENKRR